MITAYKWYCIARSNTIGSSAGVKIDIKHFRILAHVSVDWGNVVLTVQETNLTEDITGSLRLRKYGNSWYLDVKISQSYKEESIEVSLYDNDHYDWYSYTDNELSGSTICLIEDVASVVVVQNADNLWAVNADGDLYPKDKEDGTPRNIISYGGISFGGNSAAGGDGEGEEEGEGGTIGSLSNVSPSADAISEQTQILVKDSNSLEYVPRNIDEIAGFNEDKLAEYLLAHEYVTKDYLHGLIFLDTENNAVRTALNLVVEGGLSFGGVSDAGGEGGGEGGTIKYPLTWSGYSSGSFDGSVSANIVIPTTLPANDVYTWAKQPSLLLSDIPDLSSKYLLLSGGIISSSSSLHPLDINANYPLVYMYLKTYDVARTGVGYYNTLAYLANETHGGRLGVADDGTPQYWTDGDGTTRYTLIHSGNIGSYAPIYNANGNVLIGTTTDSGYKLSVKGSMQLREGDYIANRATFILNSNGQPADIIFKSNSTIKGNYGWWAISSRSGEDGRFSIFRGSENAYNAAEAEIFTIGADGRIVANGGNVLIGTTVDNGAKLQVSGGIHISRQNFYGEYDEGIRIEGASSEWCGVFLGTSSERKGCQDSQWHLLKTNTETLRIGRGVSSTSYLELNKYGKIGVGKTNQVYELDIEGSIRTTTGNVRVHHTNSDMCLELLHTHSSYSWNYIRQVSNGYEWHIGITSDVGTSLTDGSDWLCRGAYEIRGNGGRGMNGIFVRYESSNYGKLVVANSSNAETSIGYLNPNYSYYHPVWTVGTSIGDGDVTTFGWFFANTEAKAWLTSSGNFVIKGEVTFGSDARYKDKIKDTSISLKSIAEAPLFIYRWNDRDDDRVYLGTTAQYWLDTPFKYAVNTTNPDFLGLGYGELGVAIGIVNSRKLLNHESRITTLERDKEKERLKKQLKKLQYQFKQLDKQLQQYRRALQ